MLSSLSVHSSFENDNIIHVEGTVDPIRDIETINLELILSDLEQATKRMQKAGKKAMHGTADEKKEGEVLTRIIAHLESEKEIRTLGLSEEDSCERRP